MPTTATPAKEHQERWNEITADPLLRKLPYKVETNHRGQIVLSPQKNRHTFQQKAIQKTLDDLLSGGGRRFRSWQLLRAGARSRRMWFGRRAVGSPR
ncbi:hypothetical protein GGP77_003577 [Salinibacter ruber]|nr:hypothetical protein [Salinibacter ruber]